MSDTPIHDSVERDQDKDLDDKLADSIRRWVDQQGGK